MTALDNVCYHIKVRRAGAPSRSLDEREERVGLEEQRKGPEGSFLYVLCSYVEPHLRSARSLLESSIADAEGGLYGVSRETSHAHQILVNLTERMAHRDFPKAATKWYPSQAEVRVGSHERGDHFCECGALHSLPGRSVVWLRGPLRG